MENLLLDKKLQNMVNDFRPPYTVLQEFDDIYGTKEIVSTNSVSAQVERKLNLFQLLSCAVFQNHKGLVKVLIEAKCCVNMKDVYKAMNDEGRFVLYPQHLPHPLHVAVQSANSEVINMLLVAGGDPFEDHISHESEFFNCFDLMFMNDDIALFHLLKTLFDAERDRHSRSLLHIACQRGACNCVEYLVNSSVHINSTDKHGYTPLLHAVRNGYHFIKLLLDKGADPNIAVHQGNALHILLFAKMSHKNEERDMHEIVQSVDLLLTHGCQADVVAGNEHTALTCVVSWTTILGASNFVITDYTIYQECINQIFKQLISCCKQEGRLDMFRRVWMALVSNVSEIVNSFLTCSEVNEELGLLSLDTCRMMMKELLTQCTDPNITLQFCPGGLSTDLLTQNQYQFTALEIFVNLVSNFPEEKTKSTEVIHSSDKAVNTLYKICHVLVSFGAALRTEFLREIMGTGRQLAYAFVEIYLMRISQGLYLQIWSDLIFDELDSGASGRMIKSHFPRVLPLKHMSRLIILSATGKNNLYKVKELHGIPQSLLPYLLFEAELPDVK